ncbi:MAG: hypothetical protein H6832_18930 [Planctomycetes bacterium]|nr:hypothetical protein [Planctomycetota bacterium]MCB9920485.1 hypothetical protein [Planctomycetota bacterium]
MNLLTRSLISLTALVSLATVGHAQISRIAGTGCSGASYPTPTPASAMIGTTVTFNGRLCAGRMPGFFILGITPLTFTVSPPLTCSSCVLGTTPDIFLQSALVSVPIPIPNSASLIGFCFYVQTGCVNVRQCLELDGALKVCIQ